MFPQDFVVLAVLSRSLALMEGFRLVVENRNLLCAAPLIRLQIDSVMRLYAFSLVEDPKPLLVALLEDKPLNRLTSREGNSLTDRYLHQELSKVYPWVDSVYRATSSFIHLSAPHMRAPFTGVKDEFRTIRFELGSGAGRQWTEAELNEAVEAFTAATRALIELSHDWTLCKRQVAAERESAKVGTK